MKSKLAGSAGRLAMDALERPLNLREAATATIVALVLGTAYCQIYCLVAYQQMHGQAMHVLTSLHRVSIDILPAVGAFELSKRLLQQKPHPLRTLLVLLVFLAALGLASVARTTFHFMSDPTVPMRRIVADRLPTLAAVAMALVRFRLARRTACDGRTATPPEPAGLPPAGVIECVRAAGNYVEIRFGGKTRLLRMPLRQLAAQLPTNDFVQVHRSVIVNRAYIARRSGRRSICLNDGTELPVGDAFRANLDRA